MKIVWQALRAATVDTLSIAVIVVTLFGLPMWGLQSAAVAPDRNGVWAWLKYLQDGLQRNRTAERSSGDEGGRYVEKQADGVRRSGEGTAGGSANAPPPWRVRPLSQTLLATWRTRPGDAATAPS